MKGWYTHFRLTDDPFDAGSPTFRYYYGSRYGVLSLTLERALDEQRGYIVVTGPPGSGKSTLVRSVLSRSNVCAHATVSAAQAAPIAVIDALLRSREPLDDGFSPTRKRAALLDMIERARSSGRSIVCVIDDAHLAAIGQLKELLTALDITKDARRIVQIVLVGRSRLLLALHSRALSGLAGRIATQIETEALSPAEIIDFLTERLEGAGAPDPGAIFSPMAMTAVARHSRGSIAVASTLARAALARAADAGAPTVGCEVVDEAAAVYAGPPDDAVRRSTAYITSTATSTAAIGLIIVALVLAAAQIRLVGNGPTPIEARLMALGSHAPADAGAREGQRLAQHRGTPRETFLSNRPYEVQIKPPPRPGEVKPRVPAQAAPPTAASQTPRPSAVEAVKTETQGHEPAKPVVPPRKAEAPPPPAQRETAKGTGSVTTKPWVSLQVGAFRNLKSAHALQRKLARTFSDVYISTVESGGEPLYRVRVGRFRTADESLEFKSRLLAAGFPSFRVTER